MLTFNIHEIKYVFLIIFIAVQQSQNALNSATLILKWYLLFSDRYKHMESLESWKQRIVWVGKDV